MSLAFATFDDADYSTIVSYALRVVFAVYTFMVAARAINKDTIGSHSEAMWHLSALTFMGFAFFFATAILPPLASATEAPEQSSVVLKVLGWVVIALDVASFAIASSIPHGPPLHFDQNKIYSEKTIASTTHGENANVCGIVGLLLPLSFAFSLF